MSRHEPDYDAAVRTIAEAPFSPHGWHDALDVMTQAGGGWSCQLLGVERRAGIVVNHAFNVPPEVLDEFVGRDGHDPRVNPRAGALYAPMYRAVGDDDFSTPDLRRKNTFYREYLETADIPFVCAGRIPASDDMYLVVATLRSTRKGHIQSNEVAMFTELLPHMSAAVRLRMSLDDEAAALSAGTLDAVRIPAFLLDIWGRVVRQTAMADAVLTAGGVVRKRGGKLEAVDAESDARLQAAIALASLRVGHGLSGPRGQAVTLLGGGGITVAEVAPMPMTPGALRLGAVALVAFPQTSRPASADGLTLLGLTPAEASVARALADGHRPQDIADARTVSVTTIRAQVRAIYAKLEVRSVAGLAGKLRGLG